MNRIKQYPHLCFILSLRHFLLAATMFFLSLPLSAQSDEPPPVEDTITTRTTIEVAPVEAIDSDEPNYQFLPIDETDSIRLQVRSIPDSIVNRLQGDDDFWYANTAREKKKVEQSDGPGRYRSDDGPSWISTVLWVLIVGVFLALVIYYMAESGLFRRKSRIPDDKGQDLEEMPEDIFAINYQKEIDKAVANGDYRLAVRLHYLQLLKLLSAKNLIRYEQDKTNMDYLMQLHNTAYYHDFFRVTLHYEYSWYGKFAVTAETYQLILQDIKKLDNRS